MEIIKDNTFDAHVSTGDKARKFIPMKRSLVMKILIYVSESIISYNG